LGIKGGSRGNNYGFGNLVSLNPVIDSKPKTINVNKKPKVPKDRIIRISEHLYRKLKGYSSRKYNIESYETIISDLLDIVEKSNPVYQQYTRY
jgi:hypothetical protein